MAFENLPNVDEESAKNLFRECMLAPNMDIRPPTDDMRLSFEDEDFKVMQSSGLSIKFKFFSFSLLLTLECVMKCLEMTLTFFIHPN